MLISFLRCRAFSSRKWPFRCRIISLSDNFVACCFLVPIVHRYHVFCYFTIEPSNIFLKLDADLRHNQSSWRAEVQSIQRYGGIEVVISVSEEENAFLYFFLHFYATDRGKSRSRLRNEKRFAKFCSHGRQLDKVNFQRLRILKFRVCCKICYALMCGLLVFFEDGRKRLRSVVRRRIFSRAVGITLHEKVCRKARRSQ